MPMSPRNAFFLGEAAVSKDPLVLPVVEVGQIRLLGDALQGRAALAAVARHVALPLENVEMVIWQWF